MTDTTAREDLAAAFSGNGENDIVRTNQGFTIETPLRDASAPRAHEVQHAEATAEAVEPADTPTVAQMQAQVHNAAHGLDGLVREATAEDDLRSAFGSAA